jgi:hypothetical protein
MRGGCKMSKGSRRRKKQISDNEFEQNWDRIFGEVMIVDYSEEQLTPEERAYIQKILLEEGQFEDGVYRTDH